VTVDLCSPEVTGEICIDWTTACRLGDNQALVLFYLILDLFSKTKQDQIRPSVNQNKIKFGQNFVCFRRPLHVDCVRSYNPVVAAYGPEAAITKESVRPAAD
jgi:hypothetical protein